jgi:hypothetical protein
MPLFGPPNIEKLKEKRDADGLIQALGDKDARLRADAAWALWNLRDDMGRDHFDFPINVQPWNLYGERFTVRQIAPWALGEFGDARAVEPLLASLKVSDVDVHRSAAEALGKLGDARAVEALIAALQNLDDIGRRISAEALGKLGDARAVEPLIARLQDGRLDVRASAAEALGKLGDARAVGPLNAALKVTDVRASAEGALRRLLENPNVQQDLAALEAEERKRGEQEEAASKAMPSSQQCEEAVLRLATSEGQILKTIADSGPAGIDRIIEALLDEITDIAGLADFGRGPLVSDAREAGRKAAARYASDHRDSLKGDVDPRPFADKLVRPAVAAYLRVFKSSG